jgi:phosphoribosylglycinamide formyltransferase-1
MSRKRPLRIAVLLSGNGTSLENLFEHIESGDVPGEVAAVISSKAGAFGLERARRHGVPAITIPRKAHPDLDGFNDAIHAELDKHDVELVALLGFLSLFQLRGRYEGRTINVHPALMPAFAGPGFYGHHVYDSVLASGVKLTGATVHFTDDEYDRGQIILQEAVPVLEDDTIETLSARVTAVERRLVPQAIRLFAEGRIEIAGNRTIIR